MADLILNDKTITPDDELVFSYIDENKVYWQDLFAYLKRTYPESEGIWKYYKDAKSWLFRSVLKKKTLFWINILEDTFLIAFYFADSTEYKFMDSNIPAKYKQEFYTAKKFNKTRAITIEVRSEEDLNDAKKLLDLKAQLK